MRQRVTIHTDGSCDPLSKHGGWAAVINIEHQAKLEISGAAQDTTNNQMEVTALLKGLNNLTKPSLVTVITDSKNLIGWLSQGWKRRDPNLKALLERIDQTVDDGGHQLEFEWVRGHGGHVGNERCDALASQAARGVIRSGNDSGGLI